MDMSISENGFPPMPFHSWRDTDGKMRIHRRPALVDNDKIIDAGKGYGYVPTDILDTPKAYTFFMDIPGLSKGEIQVMVEDDRILVVKGCSAAAAAAKAKRKRGEEAGGGGEQLEAVEHRYIRLERRLPNRNFLRRFRLPDDANPEAITAKCENGVLDVVVEKLKPAVQTKTFKVSIS